MEKLLKKKTSRKILLGIVVSMMLFAGGCQNSAVNTKPLSCTDFRFFDTVTTIISYADESEENFEKTADEILEILKEYHQLFDIYNSYEGSNNLYVLNENAGKEAIKVDKKLIDFLLYAKKLYYLSDGEMNVMMGSVLSIWHNCREEAENGNLIVPDTEVLDEASKHIDIELLEIDEASSTVFIKDGNAQIDVGALGKGYATEKVAEYLEENGIEGYILNVGGNIRTIGRKIDGSDFRIGIRDPFGQENDYLVRVEGSDIACITSGFYERFYIKDGIRYHHIIDKDTLMPSEYFASVTVISEDCSLGDALSTALFCMSKEDGEKLADKLGVGVIWILNDKTISYNSGAKELIK